MFVGIIDADEVACHSKAGKIAGFMTHGGVVQRSTVHTWDCHDVADDDDDDDDHYYYYC